MLHWELEPGSFLTGLRTHRGRSPYPGPAPLGTHFRDVLLKPGEGVFLVKLNVSLVL